LNVCGVHGASLVLQLCLNEIEGWTKGAQQIVLVAVKGLLSAEELADDAGVFEVDSEQLQQVVGVYNAIEDGGSLVLLLEEIINQGLQGFVLFAFARVESVAPVGVVAACGWLIEAGVGCAARWVGADDGPSLAGVAVGQGLGAWFRSWMWEHLAAVLMAAGGIRGFGCPILAGPPGWVDVCAFLTHFELLPNEKGGHPQRLSAL
jgi:hypothetical protein